MKFLLDPHILLWSFFDTKKLSENIKNILLDERLKQLTEFSQKQLYMIKLNHQVCC
ncbi:hypothetical protein R83H12_00591 [Fibrobacteria bacterium R8-3-H12]